ncbi:type II secretion system protein [Mucisphaera sp.]|uniref:type II secretion system protein n=1 Tax=Mucisphaera sp. TaxID=2913024 RepID=UPI003D13CA5C
MNAGSPSRHRPGLTLIEVVAALVILGTILAGIVVARARHIDQLAEARTLTELSDVADRLITGWWLDPNGPPVNAQGSLSGDAQPGASDGDGITWRTSLVPNRGLEDLALRSLRIEVVQGETVLAVELALPAETEAER